MTETTPTVTPQLIATDLFAGKLVKLCAAREGDEAIISAWMHDSDFLRPFRFGAARPLSVEQLKEEEKKHPSKDGDFQFLIRTVADDKLIGMMGFSMTWNHQVADTWIGIGDAAYRSKGYGTEAMRLLVNYAFREVNARRMTLYVFSYNVRAIRSYEKVGFIKEGVLRQDIFRDGQYFDTIVMGLLRDEWDMARMEPKDRQLPQQAPKPESPRAPDTLRA